MQTSYGIFTNVMHGKDFDYLIKEARSFGVNAFILNGKLFDKEISSMENFADLIEKFGKLKYPTFISPSGIEEVVLYNSLIKESEKLYENIFDTTLDSMMLLEDHQLIFIPGDPTDEDSYFYSSYKENMPTNYYVRSEGEFYPLRSWENYEKMKEKDENAKIVFYRDLSDYLTIKDSSSNPILITQHPMNFNFPNSLDSSLIGVDKNKVIHNPNPLIESIIQKYPDIKEENINAAIKYEFDIVVKNVKVGSQIIRDFAEKFKIKKAVFGNCSINSGIAHNDRGDMIEEGAWTDELFWSVGGADKGMAGILTVEGNDIKYKNLF